jgi:hypothetical protein
MPMRLIVLSALLLAAKVVWAADAVDPALVGTWKLEWPRSALFWAIRPDGVYRMHGPGANPRQLGRLQAGQGRFSMQSPVWIDSGTYRLTDSDTLVITGQLGPGTWKRAWVPARKDADRPAAGAGSCRLLSAEDAGIVLMAPAAAALNPRGGSDCIYSSQLDSLDSLSVTVFPSRRQAWYIKREKPNPAFTSVPGVGEDAYVEQSGVGTPVLNILSAQDQFIVRVQLTPDASKEDVSALIDLARAAAHRLGH